MYTFFMIHTYSHKDLVWYDLENPTIDEVKQLMEQYNLDPLLAEELLTETVKPKVDLIGDHIHLVLHFPFFKRNQLGNGDKKNMLDARGMNHPHHSGANQNRIDQDVRPNRHNLHNEIDFIIGKKFLITARYGSIEPLERFAQLVSSGTYLSKRKVGDHAGFIFYYLLRDLYRDMVHEIDAMRDSLHHIENQIFHGNEKNMVYAISRINRDILTFKESTNLHKSVLESLQSASNKLLGSDFNDHIELILNEYYKSHAGILESKEFLDELRKTNDSLLTAKQNETIKLFNALAFTFLPPSVILWLFAIRSPMPFLEHNPDSFWIVVGCLCVLVLSIFTYFKTKKWI